MNSIKIKYLLVIMFLSFFSLLHAQEYETELLRNEVQQDEFNSRKNSFQIQGQSQRSSSVSIPFIDDFSTDKFPGNLEGEEVLWKDVYAFRNNSFGIEPPTIGVVTFDALDETGYPYNNFIGANAHGIADTLTSTEIDLSATSGDVVLSFFYQRQGHGNEPEPVDSLVLEFYAPGDTLWYRIWAIPGGSLDPFEQVLILIDDPRFLMDNFQFRFMNYATLSGSLDHWNLDYIKLDDNRSLTDEVLTDIAFTDPIISLLSIYRAMPWTHFQNNAASHMADNIVLKQRNNDDMGSLITSSKLSIGYQGVITNEFPNANEPSIPPFTSFTTTHSVNSSPNNFIYDIAVNDTCAFFDVIAEFFANPDDLRENDTIRFQQEFTNYYAFDDGTAERGYGVNTAGGKVAMKYDIATPDTLLGVQLYFNPIALNPEDETIFITIWSEGLDGLPDTVIYQDQIFNGPILSQELNGMITYVLEDKVFIEDNIFVGWVQSGMTQLNVGNDKNTNNNTTRLFFNVVDAWQPSVITGSLMIHPVFKSGKGDLVSGIPEVENSSIEVYPNPANDFIHINIPQNQEIKIELFDITGKKMYIPNITAKGINVGHLDNGIYVLRIFSQESKQLFTTRIVINHS